jgi:predicted esterase
MLQAEPQSLPDLSSTRGLLLSGAMDPIVPPASRDRLVTVLKQAGAILDL